MQIPIQKCAFEQRVDALANEPLKRRYFRIIFRLFLLLQGHRIFSKVSMIDDRNFLSYAFHFVGIRVILKFRKNFHPISCWHKWGLGIEGSGFHQQCLWMGFWGLKIHRVEILTRQTHWVQVAIKIRPLQTMITGHKWHGTDRNYW